MKHITLLLSILLFSTSVMAQDIDPFDVDMKRSIDPSADNATSKSDNKSVNTTDISDNKTTLKNRVIDNETLSNDKKPTTVTDNKTTIPNDNGTSTTKKVTSVLNDNGSKTITTNITTISTDNGTTTTTTTTTTAIVTDNITVSDGRAVGSSDNSTALVKKEGFFSGKPFTGLDGKQIFYVMLTGGYSSSDGRGKFNSYPGALVGATVGKQFFKYFAVEGFLGYNSAYFQSIELRGYAMLQRVIRISNNKYVIPNIGVGVSLATSQKSNGTGVNESDIGITGKVGVRFIMGRVMFGTSIDYAGRFLIHSSFSVLAEVGLIF